MFPNVKIIGYNLIADFNQHLLSAIAYDTNNYVSQYQEVWLEASFDSEGKAAAVSANFTLPDGTEINNIHLTPVTGLQNRFRVRLNEIIGNKLKVGIENEISVRFSLKTSEDYANMPVDEPVGFKIYLTNLDVTYTPDDIDVLFIGLSKLNNDFYSLSNKGITIDSSLSLSSTNPVENWVITNALNKKVDKVSGKTLTSNDFTNEYKLKLENIESTIIDSALSTTSRNAVQNRVVSAALNNKLDKASLGTANGPALLDSNGKLVLNQIPDTLYGQVAFRGIITEMSGDYPVVNDVVTGLNLKIPTKEEILSGQLSETEFLIPDINGTYFISNIDFVFENTEFSKGDWLIWSGSSVGWSKVQNTDAVTSVNGKTGNVEITKDDIGLSNVENTADKNKEVYSAVRDNYGNIIVNTYAKKTELDQYLLKTDIENYGNLVTEDELVEYDFATKTDLQSKQDSLVSGTNIKTINGQSLLGEGDIVIESGSTSVGNAVIVETGSSGYASLISVDGNITNIWNSLVTPDQLQTLYNNYGNTVIDEEFNPNSVNPVQNKVITAGFDTVLNQLNTKQDKLTIDTAISSTSTNTVQNKVIYSELESVKTLINAKQDKLNIDVESELNSVNNKINTKQDILSAGTGITITNNVISADIGLHISVVDVLPATGEELYIYLVPYTQDSSNLYTEYIWVNNKWEQIGTTQIDLSDYALKSQLPEKVSELENDLKYVTETELTNQLSAKQDLLVSGTSIKTINNESILGSGNINTSSIIIRDWSE